MRFVEISSHDGQNRGVGKGRRLWVRRVRVLVGDMYLFVILTKIDAGHVVLSQRRRRCPVIAEPWCLVLIRGGDRSGERFARTVIEDLEAGAFKVEGTDQVVVYDAAAPAVGA